MVDSLLFGLGKVLNVILDMVQLLIFASVFISWFSADPRNPLVSMVRSLTEPLYRPVRRHLTSKLPGPVDFAPFVVILLIIFIQKSLQFYIMHHLR